MFEVGFTEIILILGIALLVLGPEKLPKLANQIGALGRARPRDGAAAPPAARRRSDGHQQGGPQSYGEAFAGGDGRRHAAARCS